MVSACKWHAAWKNKCRYLHADTPQSTWLIRFDHRTECALFVVRHVHGEAGRQNIMAYFQSVVHQGVWACIDEFLCDSSTLRAWRRGGALSQAKADASVMPASSEPLPVHVRNVVEEKPQYATCSRGWQHSHLLGPRIRTNALAMPEAFAPRKSGQLALWVLPSRTNGSNEAASWQRETTIVCQTGWEIAERLSVVVCKEFALNIKSARCPRAFVSSFLGATCFRELHCLFWWLSGSAPHRKGKNSEAECIS